MQFLQANPRRRRVLADDLSTGDDATTAISPPSRSHRRIDGYAPEAKPEQQRRIIDLIPSSHLSLGLWFAAGLAVIGGLAAGQAWLPAIAGRLSAQAATCLELGASGSLNGWIASLWLGLAGATSALIYSIRRHKLDDYRGRYRWWFVGAVTWSVMSVDATCGIHQLFAATMVHLTGYTGPGGGAAWWMGCWGALLCAVSVRLAWEMRVCRPATTAYLSALALWICGIVIEMTGIRLGTTSSVLPVEIAKLLGHLSLLLGLSIYARHVILHAQGLLPARKRRSSKEKPAAPSANKTRTDLQPHVALRPSPIEPAEDTERVEQSAPLSRRDGHAGMPPVDDTEREERRSGDTSAGGRDSDADAESEEGSDQNRKLSKAERKRLRKLRAKEEQGW
jgi:hypothetical protein